MLFRFGKKIIVIGTELLKRTIVATVICVPASIIRNCQYTSCQSGIR